MLEAHHHRRGSPANNLEDHINSRDQPIHRILFSKGTESHDKFSSDIENDLESTKSLKNDDQKYANILKESDVEPLSATAALGIKIPISIDWKNKEQKRIFLMSPCSKNGMTEFYIKRHKGILNWLTPEYRVYLRTGHIFLLSSKKRPNKPTSNYLISMNYDQLKGSPGILGKLRANFVGSEYQIFDSGKNRKRVDPFFEESSEFASTEDETTTSRCELGSILYESQWIRSGEPRSMKVCIGKVLDDNDNSLQVGFSKKWQPVHKDEEMIRCFKHKSVSAKRHLHTFVSKSHAPDKDQEEFLRSFQGRVTLSSVKNFQLMGEEDGKLVMQFGRVDKDEFIMDVTWPISPFQAFAIALSSCDTKIACGD